MESLSANEGLKKYVLIEAGKDREIVDAENFQDIRIELNSTGHSLTSVLINPRETLYEDLFDEFAADQSAPLEYNSPLANLISAGANSSVTDPTTLYTMSPADNNRLEAFIKRLKKTYKDYQGLHGAVRPNEFDRNLRKSASFHEENGKSPVKQKTQTNASSELKRCYREVPGMFFIPEYTLMNPDMFKLTIMDSSEDEKNDLNQGNLLVYAGRAEQRLSHYLDLVEVALLKQIWSRSPAFFRTLDDIKELQVQVSSAINNVEEVRKNVSILDSNLTENPIQIPNLSVRQKNKSILQEKLNYMQTVIQDRHAIMTLVEVEDYFSALDLITNAQKTYHQHLSKISCMRPIGDQLDDVDNLICEIMCNKFVSMAIQWEDLTENEKSVEEKNNRTLVGDNEGLYEELELIQEKIDNHNIRKLEINDSQQQLLHSLIRTDRVQSALNRYKNRLMEAVRLIVRTCVMEFLTVFDPSMTFDEHDDVAGGGANNDTPFAQRVKEMPTDTFLNCIAMCYEHVIMSVKKANIFHDFLVVNLSEEVYARFLSEKTGNISNLTTPRTIKPTINLDDEDSIIVPTNKQSTKSKQKQTDNQDSQSKQMINLSKGCLTAACDLAQRSISQLINLHKEGNSKLPPEKMRFLWEISLNFAKTLEEISGTTAYIMRQCLLSQTKSFLDHLHERCKGKLVNTLDNERWIQCDVSAERQDKIDKLSSGKTFLLSSSPPTNNSIQHSNKDKSNSINTHNSISSTNLSNLDTNNQGNPLPGIHGSNSSPNLQGTAVKPKNKDLKPAKVDGVEFKVVWSALLLTETALTYLEVAFFFSPITKDVINKIVELFRLFNSRTKQLVLGAQAIQSAARLKSISAKHLAITGQSLGLVVALLPHIRAALLAQIPPSHHMLLLEIDRLSQDFYDHHGQIVAKFVGIVGDFVDASALKLQSMDWDRFAQGKNQQQCEYFEEVQRNVTALHRVLSTTLPPEQLQDVFSRIFALLNRKIPTHFEDIMPHSGTGKQRILDEITHLVANLSRLKQIDSTSLSVSLEDTFRSKYFPQ